MSMERLLRIGGRVGAMSRILFRGPSCAGLPSAFAEVTLDPAVRLSEICLGALPFGSDEQFAGRPTSNFPDPVRSMPAFHQHPHSRQLYSASGAREEDQLPPQQRASYESRGADVRTGSLEYAIGARERQSSERQSRPQSVGANNHSGLTPVSEDAPAGPLEATSAGVSVAAPRTHPPTGSTASRIVPNQPAAETQFADKFSYPQSRAPASFRNASRQQGASGGFRLPAPATGSEIGAGPELPVPATRWARGSTDLTRVLAANLAGDHLPESSDVATADDEFLTAAAPSAAAHWPNDWWANDWPSFVDRLIEEFERRMTFEYERTYGTSGGI